METSLEKLISLIAGSSKKEIALGVIAPREEILFNWELKDFTYTEKGAQNTSASGKETIHKDWFSSSRKLSDEIIKSKEFLEVEKIIGKEYPESTNPKYDLQRFCDLILPIYLNNPKKKNRKVVADITRRFIRDLRKEPVLASASFNVYGIVLESDRIKLADGIFIKRTAKEDFETPTAYMFGGKMRTDPYHSAILKIDMSLKRDQTNNGPFQNKADKLIALLRLFRVAPVCYTSYQMHSDVVLPPFFVGTITQNLNRNLWALPYYLKKKHERSLHYFLNNLSLPKEIYDFQEKKINHFTIAFDRYSEALIERTYPERRITNVVMGLEALFSIDSIELTFKLSNRVSKILSFFGKDSLEAKDTLLMAYKVRSIFSHGGHLDIGMKNKIEQQYTSIDNFVYLIADYLRISLIVMLSCGLKKEDLIKLIDESFIDEAKNSALKSYLIKVKTFLKS